MKIVNKIKNALKGRKSQLGMAGTMLASAAVAGYGILRGDFTAMQYILLVPAATALGQTGIACLKGQTPSVDELEYYPKVAIAIPAYNEEAVIEETVRANRAAIDYPNYDIYVIEDGSTDNTKEIVERLEAEGLCKAHYRPHNPDEKKAEALNDLAINVLKTEAEDPNGYKYICVLDADGHLAPDYLTKAMKKFAADELLKGTQGVVRIRNNNGFYGNNADVEFRNYLSVLKAQSNHTILGGNSETVDLEVFREFSPLCKSTVEDMELSILLKEAGYHVSAVTDTGVSQEAVTGFSGYVKQRGRWLSGNLSCFFEKFGDVVRSKKMSLWSKFSTLNYLSLNFYVPFVAVTTVGFLVNMIHFLLWGDFPVKYNAPLLVGVLDFIGVYPTLVGRSLWDKNGILRTLKNIGSFTAYSFLQIPVYLKGAIRLLKRDDSWNKTARVAEIEG